jgi:hypothetical protein
MGKAPDPEFDLDIPRIPNERCMVCHSENSGGKDAYPIKPESHEAPIDVSEEFLLARESPKTQECKNCHPAIAHPTDGRLIPTERGEKYNFTHPAFSYFHNPDNSALFDFASLKQKHWNISKNTWITVNGMKRQLNLKTCRKCHRGSLRAKEVAVECEGCHSGKRAFKPSRMSTVEWLKMTMGNANIGDIGKEVEVHYASKLIEYAEKEDLPRRTCVDCHGPKGTNIAGGMTDSSMIRWSGEKGFFEVNGGVHGAVHKNLTVELPVKKPKDGRILGCEECHVVGDEGNYIAIHMQHGSGNCETCHPAMETHIYETSPEPCRKCHFGVLEN